MHREASVLNVNKNGTYGQHHRLPEIDMTTLDDGRGHAMVGAPRCGARTRAGTPCRAPARRGRARCRMHGGADGSGAQPGNRNAFKHGLYSAETKARRRALRSLIRQSEKLMRDLDGT